MTAAEKASEILEAQSQALHANRMANRRVAITERGGPDVLRIIEEPVPEPAPGEVRVKIQATGVSFADLLMREGVHPEIPHATITLGWDLVGVVDKLGANVTGLNKGDSVAALPTLGGYADFICLREAQLIPVPAGLDPSEAVAICFVTARSSSYVVIKTASAADSTLALVGTDAGGWLLPAMILQPLALFGVHPSTPCEAVSTCLSGLKRSRPDRVAV